MPARAVATASVRIAVRWQAPRVVTASARLPSAAKCPESQRPFARVVPSTQGKFFQVASYVGAISSSEPRNWDRCKEVGLWGVPRNTIHARGIKPDDRLFIWRGRVGFIAEARVTGPPRAPADRSEAPRPGGPRRFVVVVPIEIVRELPTGYKLGFVRDRQEVTGLSTNSLRFGLVPVTDDAGDHISAALSKQQPERATS